MKYTCIDGFSGAGGLSLGLQKAGFNILLSFDNDPISIETQKINKRYLDHEVAVADIKSYLRGDSFLKKTKLKKGELFLLAGGPPCQGFSVQRIGEDNDSRNDLVLAYAKLIDQARPRFFLMENVPGILGTRGKPIVDTFLDRVKKMGYHTYMKMLNAEDFGVPQRRKRVFIVGIRNDVHKGEFHFPKPTTSKNTRTTVRDIIGDLPEPPADGSEHSKISHHRKDKLSAINLARIQALKPGQGMAYLPKDLLADCHKAGADKIGHRNVYGRMSWDEVAPTITARFDSFTRGKFGHPKQNRSITLREGALLQTFPKDFKFAGNKVDVARQIGNAVPVKLAEIVGKQILKYFQS